LSEIEPNFEQFLPSQIIRGGAPQKVVSRLSPPRSGTSRGKSFVRLYPLAPKILRLIR